MFTGLVQAVGTILRIESCGDDARLLVAGGELDLGSLGIGASVSVNGACLTAAVLHDDGFWADVSGETLSCTTLGELHAGSRVNLETSLTPTTALGGHLVTGHVDGVGTVHERRDDGRSQRFRIAAPGDLARYIAAKGSICVDGTSLTVNAVDGPQFEVNIVPHTLDATIMGEYEVGRRVNLEVDIIARYLERLMSAP